MCYVLWAYAVVCLPVCILCSVGSVHCFNNGTCAGGFCHCPPGFEGRYCEQGECLQAACDACTCMHDASSPGFAEHMSPMQLWGEYCAVHMTCDVGHLLPVRAETMWQWVLSERGELFPWGVCLPRWIWGRFLRSYPM